MTYTVQIKVMPLKELLDPQGKAVMGGFENLGLSGVEDVRIGKNITLADKCRFTLTKQNKLQKKRVRNYWLTR